MLDATIVRTFLVTSVLLALAGCAGSSPPPRDARSEASALPARMAALEAQNEALEQEVRELEGRLALSQAEARDLREDASRIGSTHREVVRIGAAAAPPSTPVQPGTTGEGGDEWDEPEDEDDEADSGPRPLLQLYGTRSPIADEASAPLILPEPPPGVPSRLPIAALPGGEPPEPPVDFAPMYAPAPAGVATARTTPSPPSPVIERYQAALRLVRDRRYEDALTALDQFVTAHPRHPYTVNAVYWQGEVHYALRDYRHALAKFQEVVTRHPDTSKVPDSLLKMALCHRHIGNERRARALLLRVQREFPESVAARLSVQEDAG
jgi:tol-pal system protein YbgF